MFQEDYMMRQIELIGQGMAKTLQLEDGSFEVGDPHQNEEAHELNKRLMSLLANGKINEAEDLLFEAIENHERIDHSDYFQLALDFYLKVNQYSDDYLKWCHFSREEADEGWVAITQRLKI